MGFAPTAGAAHGERTPILAARVGGDLPDIRPRGRFVQGVGTGAILEAEQDMIRKFLPLAALGALGACNDPGFTGVNGVTDALASQVTACTYITDIRMTPGVYGPVLTDRALLYARNKVMADAKDAGANTVVFDEVPPSGEVYMVHAKAYRC